MKKKLAAQEADGDEYGQTEKDGQKDGSENDDDEGEGGEDEQSENSSQEEEVKESAKKTDGFVNQKTLNKKNSISNVVAAMIA